MSQREGTGLTRKTVRLIVAGAISLLFALGQSHTARAQWTTSGANTTHTTPGGRIGIGTDSPAAKLDLTFDGATEQGLRIFDTRPAGAEIGGHLLFFGNSSGAATPTRFGQIGGLKEDSTQGSMLGFLGFYTNNGAATYSVVERMRITSAGHVGIGTASPASRLTVVNGNAHVQSTNLTPNAAIGDVGFGPGGGAYSLVTPKAFMRGSFQGDSWHSGTSLSFFTHPGPDITTATPLERLRIDKDGKVGIGTTTPLGSLHVSTGNVVIGQLYTSGANLYVGRTDANYTGIVTANNWSDGSRPVFRARNNGLNAGTTGEGIYNFLGQRDDTTRTFSADYLGNGYFAGSLNAVGGLCINGVCKTSWSEVGGQSQWTTSGTSVHYSSGSVGIGTASPGARLDVSTGAAARGGNTDVLVGAGGNVPQVEFYGATRSTAIAYDEGIGGMLFYTNGPAWARTLFLGNDGRVGVGTDTPAAGYKLHVEGDVNINGNIAAKYQDVAEWVPTTQKLAAGTVVVLDPARSNHVLASASSYDTTVAGVISEQPGIILGEGGEGKVKVATTGRVRVRVDATKGPIKIGDLLVTSDVAGVAMKSVPVNLGAATVHRPGTIVGKALEPLEKGVGEILVLLSMQ
ncbi:MAG TPA: hypothetical protein VIP46_14070 [Pyrinomonadaceae bacterium]